MSRQLTLMDLIRSVYDIRASLHRREAYALERLRGLIEHGYQLAAKGHEVLEAEAMPRIPALITHENAKMTDVVTIKRYHFPLHVRTETDVELARRTWKENLAEIVEIEWKDPGHEA